MVDEVPTDQRAADMKERQVYVSPPLVANAQTAEAVEPRDHPLNGPPVPAQLLATKDVKD